MQTAISTKKEPARSRSTNGSRRLDSLEKFIGWSPPNDGHKYEWNNGQIEKTPKMVTYKTLYIVDRLENLFERVKSSLPSGGRLFTEPQMMTSTSQLRIPDMAFFTRSEIEAAALGEAPVPEFTIEFVSENDSHKKVLEKLDEYFNAGVRIVWLIHPDLNLVYVYRSPTTVTVCRGEAICSAEPILPDFKIAAAALFEKNWSPKN